VAWLNVKNISKRRNNFNSYRFAFSCWIYDTIEGKLRSFNEQQFIGDQGHSKIMRVYMEKINGVYQGAAFPFVGGFSSSVLRMIWGSDSSMFVGMTSRGWASTEKKI